MLSFVDFRELLLLIGYITLEWKENVLYNVDWTDFWKVNVMNHTASSFII